jgi:hypothetical protein
MSNNYLPVPERVWPRVQSSCTVSNNNNNKVFLPLTKETVTQAEADYAKKILYKGNILQYRANSSFLTKNQKYSQLSKCMGPNRTKVFATQSQTYSNPNTHNLLRVNYYKLPFPNDIVGKPNNISGPFQYNVKSPFDCSNNTVVDGGNLVCGTYANQCTGEIISKSLKEQNCYSTTFSDVPGKPQLLCWFPNVHTWIPKTQLTNNTSANKWPQGYKFFVSAVKPNSPTLEISNENNNIVTLIWTTTSNNCLPISSYNIYQNNVLLTNVSYKINTININVLANTSYDFYVTSLSNSIQSAPSNTVFLRS